MKSILDKYLPLHSNSSRSQKLQEERRKDHYSHFILRLAFSSTEDLRRRFSRLETMLFTLRFKDDDLRERQNFVKSLDLQWEEVKEDEKRELKDDLHAASGIKKTEDQEWFKVDWERVPELVGQRKVLLKRGMAYVPQREQMSLVVAEFTKKLDEALAVCHLRYTFLRYLADFLNSLPHEHFLVSTKTTAWPQSLPTYRGHSRRPTPSILRQMPILTASPP